MHIMCVRGVYVTDPAHNIIFGGKCPALFGRVLDRGLEGVWGCFAACLRPKAPRGRFQDASGAALGRFLAHLGRLLGGSWAVLGTKLGRPMAF